LLEGEQLLALAVLHGLYAPVAGGCVGAAGHSGERLAQVLAAGHGAPGQVYAGAAFVREGGPAVGGERLHAAVGVVDLGAHGGAGHGAGAGGRIGRLADVAVAQHEALAGGALAPGVKAHFGVGGQPLGAAGGVPEAQEGFGGRHLQTLDAGAGQAGEFAQAARRAYQGMQARAGGDEGAALGLGLGPQGYVFAQGELGQQRGGYARRVLQRGQGVVAHGPGAYGERGRALQRAGVGGQQVGPLSHGGPGWPRRWR